MGIYVTLQDVKVRLNGKVRFTEDPEAEGHEDRMSMALANRLISEAESQVEEDLSSRYAAPFQTVDGTKFQDLPMRPTKDFLKTLCELQAVVRILETDFGSGGPSSGDKYADKCRSRYKQMKDSHLELKKDSYNTYIKPPLPSLMLNYQNEENDTGFKGRAFSMQGDGDDGSLPSKQINSPGEVFWNVDESDFL